MKIISLNIWGGRAGGDKVLQFLDSYQDSVDVFCLQEVWSDTYEHLNGVNAGGRKLDISKTMTQAYQEISELLTDFEPIFHPHFGDHYGLMMLVKKKYRIESSGEVFVYRHKGYEPPIDDIGRHARNIQYVTLRDSEREMTIINFHGLWNGQGKGDSDERLEQSAKILEFIDSLNNPYVLCGDFNLTPETESLKKFEAAGMRNLIRKFNITSTRTSYYDKEEQFADYVFVSPELKVENFEVLQDEVSDHAPLFVDIEWD